MDKPKKFSFADHCLINAATEIAVARVRNHSAMQDALATFKDVLPEVNLAAVGTTNSGDITNEQSFEEQQVFEVIKTLQAQDPAQWGDITVNSVDALDAETTRRLHAEWQDAQDTLNMGGSGSGMAEFLGRMGAAATDPTSLALMPLGGGGTVTRMIVKEVLLGAAGEAAILPRMNDQAEKLDIPDPNALAQITMGAAFGGGLAGLGHAVVSGWKRFNQYRAGRNQMQADGDAAGEALVRDTEAALARDSEGSIAADAQGAADLRAAVSNSPSLPFGPEISGFRNNPEGAIKRLMETKSGEVTDAFEHPDLGNIAFVYGNENFGLRHIQYKHGDDVLADLPRVLRDGHITKQLSDRVYIQTNDTPPRAAVIRLDYDGQQKTWLVTSFDDQRGTTARQVQTSDEPPASAPSRIPDATGQGLDITSTDKIQEVQVSQALKEVRESIVAADDFEITTADGQTYRASEILDDLDVDANLADIINLCNPKGGA